MNEKQPNIENLKSSDEKHIDKKLRNVLIGALILANLALPVGCGDKNVSAENGPNTTAEENYNDSGSNAETNEAIEHIEVTIPPEASGFVAEYGDQYDDTQTAIGAYYAAEAYEKENKLDPMFDRQFKNFYNEKLLKWWDIENPNAGFDPETQTDLLGFKLLRMSELDALGSKEITEKAMDGLIGPMTELMVNYLIKNPDTESKEIVKWEYIKMCSPGGYNPDDYLNNKCEKYINASNEYMDKVVSIASAFKGNQNIKYIPTTDAENGSSSLSSGYAGPESNIYGYDVREQGIDATMNFAVETYDTDGKKISEKYSINIGIGTVIENNSNYLFFGN